MAISRESIPAVVVPETEVPCAPLGGDVVVRPMDLVELLLFNEKRNEVKALLDGETEAQADARRMNVILPWVLARCVLADDRQPVYSEQEWRIWCAKHLPEGYELFAAATVGAEKKT
jgi:hypothetical protein